MVYCNLNQNICDHWLPATEETNKRLSTFSKVFREHFCAIWEIPKHSNSFKEEFSGVLQNVNRSRNRIFPEFYLTLFQIILLLCAILNSIKISPTVFPSQTFSPRYETFSSFFACFVTLSPRCNLSPHIIDNYQHYMPIKLLLQKRSFTAIRQRKCGDISPRIT